MATSSMVQTGSGSASVTGYGAAAEAPPAGWDEDPPATLEGPAEGTAAGDADGLTADEVAAEELATEGDELGVDGQFFGCAAATLASAVAPARGSAEAR